MNLKEFTAIAAGKTVLGLTRTLKVGGGSAAPGLYALKIYPDLISKLSRQIPQTVVITGTNGKTTTARMLAYFATQQGLRVLRNTTGSNLERGIASALINSYQADELLRVGRSGPATYDLAVWEVDEAAFNLVLPQIKPDLIIFLNVFRDQLDRYGEVDSVVKKWAQTLKHIDPQTTILINGDDANLLELRSSFRGRIRTFGVKNYKISGEKTFADKQKTRLDFEAVGVKTIGLQKTSFSITWDKFSTPATLPLPGVYHVYNFLAAFAAAHIMDLPLKPILKNLPRFSPAFGRVEKLTFKYAGDRTREGYIFLIKNPAGATQVFQTIAPELKKDDRLFLALNDKLADGTDVSWIWDTEFEKLKRKVQELKIFVSGSRAEDLALRLKYAGFDPADITVNRNLVKSLSSAKRKLSGRLFILPTYTALLELQKILAKSGVKQHYWKES